MSDLQRIKYSLHFSSLYLHKPSVENVSHSSNPSWINTDLLPSQTLIIHSAHFNILSLSKKEKKLKKKQKEEKEEEESKLLLSLSSADWRGSVCFQLSRRVPLSCWVVFCGEQELNAILLLLAHAASHMQPVSPSLSLCSSLTWISCSRSLPFSPFLPRVSPPAYHFGMLPLSVSLSLSQAFSSIYCAAFSFLFLFLNLEVLLSLLQSLSHTLSVFLSLKLNLHLSQFTLLALPYSAICQSPLSHIYIDR